jgi:hypothetical protein
LTPLWDWATALVLAVSTEEEAFAAKESRSGYQPGPELPPPLSPPFEPESSEPEDVVVVVVVVESEPPPGPELDPEEPLFEEPCPELSLPEVVEVLLPPSLLPLVVG